jgi:predicted transcriptional regulator
MILSSVAKVLMYDYHQSKNTIILLKTDVNKIMSEFENSFEQVVQNPTTVTVLFVTGLGELYSGRITKMVISII